MGLSRMRGCPPLFLIALLTNGALSARAFCAPGDPAPTVLHGVTVVAPDAPIVTGPVTSATGANDYKLTGQDIANLPTGGTTPMTDVLAQLPGVAIDQNQQIHIRNTEGPQFQYQIDGVLVPLDINTNPPFLSMINPLFVQRLDLLDGVLPARYSYATGGVIDIQPKDGCQNPGGSVSVQGGQRDTLQPSVAYGGCSGQLGYFVSGLYKQSDEGFSSATPGAEPVHDDSHQGQIFGYFSYPLDGSTKLSLVLSAAVSDNQLPNVANLAQIYTLSGVPTYASANINSNLNFRDYLAIVKLAGAAGPNLTYQLAYSAHFITEEFRPDNAGELIFQGVASTATHYDIDNTLEGDLTYRIGAHKIEAGFYVADYHVTVNDRTLTFPVFLTGDRIHFSSESAGGVHEAPAPTSPELPNGPQSSTTPVAIVQDIRANNLVLGVYIDDLWRIAPWLDLNVGIRLDGLTGFTAKNQIDPTFNLIFRPDTKTSAHVGFARYMQAPSFQGISAYAPEAFAGTVAGGLSGVATPLTEDDYEWDAGLVHHFGRRLTLSQDVYYEVTDHYLDTGQFGVVPIFAPFNYGHGHIWGSETALSYKADRLSAYANLTLGQNRQKGVDTGQFNFDEAELAYIQAHGMPLDHQPLASVSAGATYRFQAYRLSLSGIYSSGLRSGFADQQQLPSVVQMNGAVERSFDLPGGRRLIDRLAILNLFDRVNQIRPAEGIGIFQAAYGPRFTILDTVSFPF